MNMDKIKRIIGSTKGKVAIAAFIGLVVGIGASGASEEQASAVENLTKANTKIEELAKTNEELTKTNEELTKTKESLQGKVDEAKPFFDMEESKRQEEIAKAEQEAARKQEQEEKEAAKKQAEQEKKEAAEKKAELDAKSKTLSSGNYTAGEDFEPGTYDIVAIKGGGNVSSSNMFSGGINAVMGSTQKIKEAKDLGMSDLYENEYKNIKLTKGVTLKVSDVTIKLVPKE